jgi:hypothetical protein
VKVEFAVGAVGTDIMLGFGVDGTGIAPVRGLGATVGEVMVDILVGNSVTAPGVSGRIGAEVSAAADGERVSVEIEGTGVSAGRTGVGTIVGCSVIGVNDVVGALATLLGILVGGGNGVGDELLGVGLPIVLARRPFRGTTSVSGKTPKKHSTSGSASCS